MSFTTFNSFQFASRHLREIVYGGSDGIVTTFAIVAGFAGAGASNNTLLSPILVVLFGLANLFADATSMGLGNFLSSLAHKDVYRGTYRKLQNQIDHHGEAQILETVTLLQKEGFSAAAASQMSNLIAKNKPFWEKFTMVFKHNLSDSDSENPAYNALATFGSFIIFGFIPVAPFILVAKHEYVFAISCAATALALVLLGSFRYFVTREHIVRAIAESLVIGGVSATVAYLVGIFFKG